MLVKSYNEYILLLEKEIKQNSNKELSDAQVAGFIRRYHLDTDWKIVLSEVKTDMKDIMRRLEKTTTVPAKPKIATNNSTQRKSTYSTPNRAKTIQTYEQYMSLLESLVRQNSGQPLSEAQISGFITRFNLGIDWQINSEDVKKDMSAIVKRLIAKSRSYETKPLEKKPPFQSTVKTSSQGITNRLVFSNPTHPSPSKCQLYESDYQYISKINAVLSKYPELMSSSRRMTGVLADILPGKSLEVNLLSFLIERGIFASIKESKLMDDYLSNKYVYLLEQNFGTSRVVAERMVLILFHAYGKMILGKTLSL